MLAGISWSQYLIFCGTALALYYLVLMVIYGKGVVLKLKKYAGIDRNVKRNWYPQDRDIDLKEEENSMQLSLFNDDVDFHKQPNHDHKEKQSSTDIYYPVVHDLVDEIEAFLQATGKSSEKQHVLESLKTMLQKYAVLKGTSISEGIDNLIVSTCENYCSIHLSEDEVSELWS